MPRNDPHGDPPRPYGSGGGAGTPREHSPKLLAELWSLALRLTPSGAMTIHHPGSGSDDLADALMLASRARVIPGPVLRGDEG